MLCAPDGGCCVLKVMAVVVCLVGDAVFKGSWLLLWAQWGMLCFEGHGCCCVLGGRHCVLRVMAVTLCCYSDI